MTTSINISKVIVKISENKASMHSLSEFSNLLLGCETIAFGGCLTEREKNKYISLLSESGYYFNKKDYEFTEDFGLKSNPISFRYIFKKNKN